MRNHLELNREYAESNNIKKWEFVGKRGWDYDGGDQKTVERGSRASNYIHSLYPAQRRTEEVHENHYPPHSR